jgi:hypothetical protein
MNVDRTTKPPVSQFPPTNSSRRLNQKDKQMKAITADGNFTFEIIPRNGKFVGTVKNHTAGAYDTTGKPPDSGHEWHFDSLGNAKTWADVHSRVISAAGDLIWE